MFSLSVIAFLGFIALILLPRLYRSFTSPLRNIPGPFLARFTRLWELYAQWTGRLVHIHIDLHNRYNSSVIRLAPNRYSFASPAAVKTIYGHGSKFQKTSYYKAFDLSHEDNIFSTRDSVSHAAQRRRIAPLYAMSSLVGYEKEIDSCTATLTSKFSEFARARSHVPMREWLQYYAYDVIGSITVGKPFGIMDLGKDTGILEQIDTGMMYSTLVGLIPEWHTILDRLSKWLNKVDAVQREIEMVIEKKSKALKDGVEDRKSNDFLDKLLVLLREGRIGHKDMQNSVGGNIGAGSDTTAISLSSVVLELARNPSCAKKLQEEIAHFDMEGKLSDPITFKEAQQMPYLQAVIKEGLRIHPAIGQILSRYVPAGGVELEGYFFPEGTAVGVNAWVLHRNTEVFGMDAASFRPERWLQSKEESARMDRFDLTFGAGSRTCVGKHISLIEMNKVLPQLFRVFDFELVELKPHQSDWFVKQNFECRIELRGSGE